MKKNDAIVLSGAGGFIGGHLIADGGAEVQSLAAAGNQWPAKLVKLLSRIFHSL